MPDARCTRGLMCKLAKKGAHEHTGSAENIRHSLRNGFTAYNALTPEYRALLASVALRETGTPARLSRRTSARLDADH